MGLRGWRGVIGAGSFILCLAVMPGPAGASSYLGLSNGDTISAITYDSPLAGVSYTASTGVMHVSGFVTTIVASSGVLTEITGGMFVLDVDFVSESLTPTANPDIFDYTATFAGVVGNHDIELYAPICPGAGCNTGPGTNDPESDGFDPEQDGRLLIKGDFGAGLTLTSTIDVTSPAQTFALDGLFTVTGGDGQFRQVYGDIGSISFIGGGVDNFNPLLIDSVTPSAGLLNPPTDTEVFDSDFTSHVAGQVIPLGGSAFSPIPEPSSLALLGLGLGWFVRRGLRK
jgi:hypothetical protein